MNVPQRDATAILLASPREPSDGSWLINCLLELGVRVDFKPTADRVWRSNKNPGVPSAMWQPAPEGRWRLHPRAEALRKWLPILTRRGTLAFRDDVQALYVQDLPRPEFAGARTALFVRDPRDAIHSLYRRIRPDMSLQDFVRFPHSETLLDAIAHWRLFVESWLARDGIHFYRFEDYKADAVGLLTRIVRDLGLEASPEAIAHAASESSYEKARTAEERYRATHPRDGEVAMRAGRVGEWKSSQELRDLSREIEERAGPLLTRLGYAFDGIAETSQENEGVSHLRFLSVFEQIELPPGRRETAAAVDPMACPLLSDTLKLASTLDANMIRRARLQAREARALLDSLQEYLASWQGHQGRRIDAARAEFDDGANYHMTRIRELMATRRAARNLELTPTQDETLPTIKPS